jgi:hypothetical protein
MIPSPFEAYQAMSNRRDPDPQVDASGAAADGEGERPGSILPVDQPRF